MKGVKEFSFCSLMSQQSCLLIVSSVVVSLGSVCAHFELQLWDSANQISQFRSVVRACRAWFLTHILGRKLCALWNCFISPESHEQDNIQTQMRNRHSGLREMDPYDSS